MSNEQLHLVRQRLREALAGVDRRGVPHLDFGSGDALESALSEMEIDLAAEAADAQWRKAKDVQRALRRIESSEYGVCESCAEPIGERRLKALPWAVRCVACQAAAEVASAARGGRANLGFESPDAALGGMQ